MSAHTPAAPDASRQTMVRLSAYIDRPLREVMERLERTDLDDLLANATRAALGPNLAVEFETGDPVWESGIHVHVPVSWVITGPRRSAAGEGAVALLTVQSGRFGITEVLADLSVPPDSRREAARVTRRVLDDVTRALELNS